MAQIEKLIPKVKVGEIPRGASIDVDSSEWKIKVINPDGDPIITIEYVGIGPGWGIVKLEAPNPDLDLQDLVLATTSWLISLIKYEKAKAQPEEGNLK
jgi:hypothetical protein